MKNEKKTKKGTKKEGKGKEFIWKSIKEKPGVSCKVLMRFQERSILGMQHMSTGHYEHLGDMWVVDNEEMGEFTIDSWIDLYLLDTPPEESPGKEKITVQDIEDWITDRIESINGDIQMDKECKEEGTAIPFGKDNKQWLDRIIGRKEGLEDLQAHIECSRLNEVFHLLKQSEESPGKEREPCPCCLGVEEHEVGCELAECLEREEDSKGEETGIHTAECISCSGTGYVKGHNTTRTMECSFCKGTGRRAIE